MNKLKHLFNLSRVFFSYILKREYCHYMPVKLWIESTNRCNLKCGICFNKEIPDSEKGNMDLHLYKKIIDEAEGSVYDINLFHRGEPLLHPDIVKMIYYAKNKGMKTRIHTNATLLTSELARDIILSDLDTISFSFDGYTKKTYEENRAGAKYEESLKNIIGFLKIKKELDSDKPFTILQVIEPGTSEKKVMNISLKEGFLRNFSGLPLDKLAMRIPHNWGGLVKLEGTDRGQLENMKMVSCTFPWYSLTILYDGTACLCPQDFKGNINIGNLNKNTIRDIFNSKKTLKMRKLLGKGNTVELQPCNNCDRIRRKTFMGVPKEYADTFIRDNLRS